MPINVSICFGWCLDLYLEHVCYTTFFLVKSVNLMFIKLMQQKLLLQAWDSVIIHTFDYWYQNPQSNKTVKAHNQFCHCSKLSWECVINSFLAWTAHEKTMVYLLTVTCRIVVCLADMYTLQTTKDIMEGGIMLQKIRENVHDQA